MSPHPVSRLLPVVQYLAVTLATFLLPTLLHAFVTRFSSLYEFLGRRSPSPYESTPWGSIVLAVGLLLVWHGVLGRLSYVAVGKRRGNGVQWGRVLGRVVMPGILVGSAVGFVGGVLGR